MLISCDPLGWLVLRHVCFLYALETFLINSVILPLLRTHTHTATRRVNVLMSKVSLVLQPTSPHPQPSLALSAS